MPKKESIELKEYIKQLEKSAGRKDDVKKLLDNDELLKKYFILQGANPEWMELPAVFEVIKNRFGKALKQKQKFLRVKSNEFIMGRTSKSEKNKYVPNKITQTEFELGDDEKFVLSKETGMIEYTKTKGKANFEKREIDPKNGVIMTHIKRFGGEASNEAKKSYYSSVEYRRDPKLPKVYYKASYRNLAEGEKKPEETFATEYDYGNPVELEKNGTTHTQTPIYFMKRYPKYKQWFYDRYRTKDEYVEKVYSMQKDSLNSFWKDERKSLESSIMEYAKTKDQLDVYYRSFQELFSKKAFGPLYKSYITNQIENIISNDENGIFYEFGSDKEMLNKIETRLNEEVEKKPFEDVVKNEGKKVVDRIAGNPDFKEAKETFKGKSKSIYDENYSMDQALEDIDSQSNLVEELQGNKNPFRIEQDRLYSEIHEMKIQMNILEAAYKSFPRRKKGIAQEIKKIEKKEKDLKKIIPEAIKEDEQNQNEGPNSDSNDGR